MQLLIILALLVFAGKSNAQNLIEEVKPVLESIGGEEMKEALKSAEEISTVLSAVKEFTSSANAGGSEKEFYTGEKKSGSKVAFPLEPVNNIADRDIAYSLSKYIEAEA